MAEMKFFAQNLRPSSAKNESDLLRPGEHSAAAAFKFAAVHGACVGVAKIAAVHVRRFERGFAS